MREEQSHQKYQRQQQHSTSPLDSPLSTGFSALEINSMLAQLTNNNDDHGKHHKQHRTHARMSRQRRLENHLSSAGGVRLESPANSFSSSSSFPSLSSSKQAEPQLAPPDTPEMKPQRQMLRTRARIGYDIYNPKHRKYFELSKMVSDYVVARVKKVSSF